VSGRQFTKSNGIYSRWIKIIIPWNKWLGISTQSGEPSGILQLGRPTDLLLSAVRTIDTSGELNMPHTLS
jgi:hypothetical protein